MDEKAELIVDFLIIFLLAIRNRERERGLERGYHCLKPSGLYKIVSYVLFYLYFTKTQGEVRSFIVVFILQIRRTPEIVSALPRVTLSSSKEKPDRLTVFGSVWLSFSHCRDFAPPQNKHMGCIDLLKKDSGASECSHWLFCFLWSLSSCWLHLINEIIWENLI